MPAGLSSPFLLLVQAVWLLAPGLVAGAELARRDLIARYLVVPVAGVFGAVLSYAAVWIYLASRTAGEVYSYLTAGLAAAAAAGLALRPAYRRLLATVDVAAPLVLLYLLTLFLVTATFGCTVRPVLGALNDACHLTGLTGDNILPQLFADNVLNGHPRTPAWDWQPSARPPLQSGAVLMQTPVTGPGQFHFLGYQTLAVLLQVLCLPAVWALLRILRLSGYRLVAVLTMFVFTGFFVYNSVFVWPKLLAAGLTLTAYALLFHGRPGRSTWALAGVAAGAGLVAHAGVAFTLLPMAFLLLRRRPAGRHAGLALAGAVAMQAPWTAYQRVVDPPGDQLLKWHFAGVWQPAYGPDRRSLTEVLADSYGSLSVAEILHHKWTNFLALFGERLHGPHLAGPGPLGILRAEEMFFVLFALGVFNLALVPLLAAPLRRRLALVLDLPALKPMAAVAGLTLVIWPLLLFGPGDPGTSPTVFQGSYATMALLFVVLGAVLTVLPRWATTALVAVNVTWTTALWIVLVWIHHHAHWSYLALSGASWLALLAFLGWTARWLDVRVRVPAQTRPGMVSVAPATHHATRRRIVRARQRDPHRRVRR
ncbi:hypothetical protein ACFFX1_42855 [Dactylosporangium sucinum]|uniref:Uncharacterized protein n=1 Tax=Dactylosporangium sucinum TaxID=1424081 RepID=A0A917TYJ5_9ACTN|nr:hypothetical protein [Dactylosporangium sucinum]GGM44680.1 hypothetical protein GCM10007977_052870 [Dactylosporangium sucinum]